MSGTTGSEPAGRWQEAFRDELTAALARIDPPGLGAVEWEQTPEGALVARLPHRHEEVTIEALVTDDAIVVGVDPVAELIGGRAAARTPELRTRAAVGFIVAMLSGFEIRTTTRGDEKIRVEIAVPDGRGGEHRVAARFGRWLRPGGRRTSVRRVTYLDL